MEALEWLWPSRCGGCDAEGAGWLCPDCRALLEARPVTPVPEGLRGGVAAAAYDGPIGDALKRAKYGRDRLLLRRLGRALARTVAPRVGPVDAVVDVPSPWTRRLARGFATGAVLAHAVAKELGVPWVRALSVGPGQRNAGLGALGRRRNLAGRVRARASVAGRVLLVDDVLTTGATVEACTRELLGTASGEVWVAVLCAVAAPDAADPPQDALYS